MELGDAGKGKGAGGWRMEERGREIRGLWRRLVRR